MQIISFIEQPDVIKTAMRILFITGSFPPMRCGVGDYAATLAEALGKLPDTKVAVLTDTRACTARSDLNFELFPSVHGWKISDLPHIIKTVRRWKPDVVHIQYPTQGYGRSCVPWFLPIILFLLNVKIVQTWHENFPMASWRNLANAIVPGGLIVVRPNYIASMPAWSRWLIRNKCFDFIPNASTIPEIKLSDAERSLLHKRFTSPANPVVVFFGFAYPHKGVEQLFEILDPAEHHLLLISDLDPMDPYHKKILAHMQHGKWLGKVTATGFLPAEDVGRILAIADAVVLPFRDGGGRWNTSVHSALAQGTFVLTTSYEQHGYFPSENIYYAHPGDVGDMRQALHLYLGRRNQDAAMSQYISWETIANMHKTFYQTIL